MQVNFDKTHRKGWVTDLKQLLFSNGFGHVWISQGVGNEELTFPEFHFENEAKVDFLSASIVKSLNTCSQS